MRWRYGYVAVLVLAVAVASRLAAGHDAAPSPTPDPWGGSWRTLAPVHGSDDPSRSSGYTVPVVDDGPTVVACLGGCRPVGDAPVTNLACLDRIRCVGSDGGWCDVPAACAPVDPADPPYCTAASDECRDVRAWMAWKAGCDRVSCDERALDRCYGAEECLVGGGGLGQDAFRAPADPVRKCGIPPGCGVPDNPFEAPTPEFKTKPLPPPGDSTKKLPDPSWSGSDDPAAPRKLGSDPDDEGDDCHTTFDC
jgi:hypothetical protein